MKHLTNSTMLAVEEILQKVGDIFRGEARTRLSLMTLGELVTYTKQRQPGKIAPFDKLYAS